MKTRYKKECIQLADLANKALNLPKNINKPNFENLRKFEIFKIFDEEYKELMVEILNEVNSSAICKERIIEELSDCAACLVGILAWINNKK